MNIFIAGPRAIHTLPDIVQDRLHSILHNGHTVFIGDASGIDKAVQDYFAKQQYSKVKVFATEGKARNNRGKWEIVTVNVEKKLKGFDFYAAKDVVMADTADYGLMIWNGESKGTLQNIINLVKNNKHVLVYFFPRKEFALISRKTEMDALLSYCNTETKALYTTLIENVTKFAKQTDSVNSSFGEGIDLLRVQTPARISANIVFQR